MRLIRIDRLAPGGAPLELHPRLTLLVGASVELRRRLLSTVRAVVSEDGPPECTGTIEVSGVLLALDRPTLDQLRLDPAIDPVLTYSDERESGDRHGPPPTPVAGGDVEPAGEQWVTSTVVADRRRVDLRLELRSVTAQRTLLGEEMEQTRAGLDSFSRASMDVCRGQLDALEARRAALRSQWEEERDDRLRRREELVSIIGEERASLDRIGDPDPTPVRVARDRLHALLDVPARPDPAALDLAARIDELCGLVHAAQQRRRAEEQRVDAATAELVAAREELASVEQSANAPVFDPAVVRRLEQVRDEIFSADERVGPFGAGRGKRRLQELRAEEAVLLDRLGFDTYSAYVMGIRSVRADMDRLERLGAALERLERAEAELGAARLDSVMHLARDEAAELDALLRRAAELGETGPLPDPADTDALLRTASDAVARLRVRELPAPDLGSAEVREALDALIAVLEQRGVPRSDLLDGLDPFAPDPRAVLDVVDRWIEGAPARIDAARTLAERLDGLRAELDELDATPEPERDVSDWAQVEAEIDSALDRLAAASERVRSHEAAMERLAELRAEELKLRERERELLASVAQVDQDVPPPPPTPDPSSDVHLPPPHPVGPGAEMPPPFAPGAAEPDRQLAQDPEWRLVSRLAEQRAVSFAGSLPLVIDGLPAAAGARDAVLERIAAMSDIVQIVLLSDDPEVAARVTGLGEDAAVAVLS